MRDRDARNRTTESQKDNKRRGSTSLVVSPEITMMIDKRIDRNVTFDRKETTYGL
jgi:hypothetical protein